MRNFFGRGNPASAGHWAVVAVLALGACGGGGGGASGPDEVVKGLIDAAKSGDVAKAATFFPTRELASKYLECPAGDTSLAQFDKVGEEIGKELPKIKQAEFLRRDTSKDDEKTVAAGEDVRGCKAKAEFKMLKTRIVFKGEGGEEDGDTMRFFVFDGKYYLAKM